MVEGEALEAAARRDHKEGAARMGQKVVEEAQVVQAGPAEEDLVASVAEVEHTDLEVLEGAVRRGLEVVGKGLEVADPVVQVVVEGVCGVPFDDQSFCKNDDLVKVSDLFCLKDCQWIMERNRSSVSPSIRLPKSQRLW